MALLVHNTPVQGYPSHPDGLLGASAPAHEEDTIASSLQYNGMSLLKTLEMFCDQEDQSPSFTDNKFIANGRAQYDTLINSNWNHCQHQIYQQDIGDVFGATDQHTDTQYYDQLPYCEQVYSPMLAQTGYCSCDQFMGSVQGDTAASESNGHVDLDGDDFLDMTMLCDGDPQDCVGTQDDGTNLEALQSEEEPQWSCAQLQHTADGHQCDGPTSRCVSEFWE
ncbi:unnamed protein product [Urochloa humidicola]